MLANSERNLLFWKAAKSFTIASGHCRWIILPLTFSESMAFLDAWRLQGGLTLQEGMRVLNIDMQFRVINHTYAPIVIGN